MLFTRVLCGETVFSDDTILRVGCCVLCVLQGLVFLGLVTISGGVIDDDAGGWWCVGGGE